MPSLGSALLALAFLTAVAAAVIALLGRNGERRWIDLSRRIVYAFFALVTACVVIIEIAFAGDDFSFNIVAEHSSIETPDLLQAGGDVVEPGGLAAALGLGALDRLRPPPSTRPATSCASSSPGRPR